MVVYIYPKEIVEKSNLRIVNFHNGLLPEYKGRNAPTWALYNEEMYTGATWHLIDEKIDEGCILARRAIKILEHEKAYELCKRISDLALNLFVQSWMSWIETSYPKEEIDNFRGQKHFYLAEQIPNNGIVDMRTDSAEFIYRVLRACDYGKKSMLQKIVLIDNTGVKHKIVRYRRLIKQEKADDGNFYLNMSDCVIKIVVDKNDTAEE